MIDQNSLAKKVHSSALLHDISNSLTGVSIALEQIIQGLYGSTLEEIKPLLVCLWETNNKITHLVEVQKNNYSEMSIEASCISEIDMLDFLQKLYLEYLPLAQSRSLGFHYQISPRYQHGTQMIGDVTNLWRMMSNLIQNAIKYTNSGDIFLRLINQGDDLVIEIEDTGIGIESEDIVNVFQPFYRGEGAKHHPLGSGLGLYVALSVAKAHGLKLLVDSSPIKGTLFKIVFPHHIDSP